MTNQGYVILQTLAAEAWADGQLKACERRFLMAVASDNRIPSGRWGKWLTSPPPLPTTSALMAALPDATDRLDLVTQMLALSWSDQEVSPEEWAMVESVGKALGVPQEALQSMFEGLAA